MSILNDFLKPLYMVDPDTYELLEMNDSVRDSLPEIKTDCQTCYQVMKGTDQPCAMCPLKQVEAIDRFAWKHTHGIVVDLDRNETVSMQTLIHEATSLDDALTGLKSRAGYLKDYQKLKKWHGAIGIGYLNIQQMKLINDVYGYQQGDLIIMDCADAIREVFDHLPQVLIYRISENEFLIFATGVERMAFISGMNTLKERLSKDHRYQTKIQYDWEAESLEQNKSKFLLA